MKKEVSLAIVTTFAILASSCGNEDFNVDSIESWSIASQFSETTYEIQVLLPRNHNPGQTYRLAVLLDGYYHFNDVANLAHNNSYGEDLILVGVFYDSYPFSLSNLPMIEELREFDLTYPVNVSSDGSESGGGGLDFYQFLEEELLSELSQRYLIDDSSKILMGHSLAGYFSLFQLLQFRETPQFHNVIALSPSLWWSNLEIIEMEALVSATDEDLPFNLFLGIGSQEGVEANVLVDELSERIKGSNYPSLNFRNERYSGGHLHSAKTGFDQGLKFIFQ